MKIDKIDQENLTSKISVTLSKEDYQPKFVDELKKYRGKVQMKGFRKGKTPINLIKKMYGQSLLSEIVFESIQKALNDYLNEEKIKIVAQPLPSKDQELLDLDPNNLQDYTLSFDIGLAPEFEIKGLDDTYALHKVDIPDATIEEELKVGQRKLGKQVETEETIEEKDMLTISAKELEDGEVKKKGHETGFTVLTETIADESLKEKIMKSKVGFEFDFDIYQLEKDRDEKYVKKYLLNLDEEEEIEVGNMFRGKIDKVMRLQEAELNEDFFSSYFGNKDIKNTDDAKSKIREEIEKFYEGQAKAVMNRKVMESVMDQTEITVPEEFLKRWLKENNTETTEEEIEKEFPAFLDNFKWTLIKNKLSDKYDIKVEYPELQDAMRQRVMSYMQGYPMEDGFVNDMVARMMDNKEQVNKLYEEIQANKVFESLEKDLATEEKSISLDEFRDIVKDLNESLQK